jgi:hypothetical protein
MKRKQSPHSKALLPRTTIIAGAIVIITGVIIIFVTFSPHNVSQTVTNVTQDITFQHPLKPLQMLKPIQDTLAPDVHPVVNRIETPANADGSAVDGSTHDTPPIVTQAGTGEAADALDIDRSWIYRYLESVESARQRTAMIARIDGYLHSVNSVQGLIDLVPLMVDLGAETGNDPRMAPVTALAESTCGRGSNNLFGVLGNSASGGSVESQVRFYFSQITSYRCNGDCWRIAFIWYDSSDPGGRATNYASNIVNSVRSI